MGCDDSTNSCASPGSESKDASIILPSSLLPPKSVCRIVFLGAAKVGKTSIIRRFLRGSFEPKYTPTVDDVYSAKFVVHGRLANVELMDTSGGFDFPAMIRLCIAKADAFVIVFAHDSMESLATANRYLDQIKSEREDYAPLMNDAKLYASQSRFVASPPPLVVVCNKSDLPPSVSKVSEGAIMEWLLKSRVKPSQFVYSSAKTDDYITDVFKALWTQNEVTKAVHFPPWTERRRGSATTVLSSSSSSKTSNSSPTEKAAPSPAYEMFNKRTSFFRNSFKLRRRNSSRQRKNKSELIHLDCTLS